MSSENRVCPITGDHCENLECNKPAITEGKEPCLGAADELVVTYQTLINKFVPGGTIATEAQTAQIEQYFLPQLQTVADQLSIDASLLLSRVQDRMTGQDSADLFGYPS